LKGAETDAQPRPQKRTRPFGMSYLIDENPPWYVCLLLGFQVRAVNVDPAFISNVKISVLSSSSRGSQVNLKVSNPFQGGILEPK